ncbi:MAG: YigZ family protein [Clostridiales bacterium]|nr:YigZ family protein [Clostridiales bacterium]
MSRYLGVTKSVTAEFTEQRSRFIGYSFPVENEEQARAEIAKIRKEHSLATHVCYAFIADKAGNIMRYSDDGEPQGTAGIPILEVLKNKGVKETGVAVVRYFGGIKLGAGGLVRAYAYAAGLSLDANEIKESALAAFCAVRFSYELSDAFRKVAERENLTPEYEYAEEITARFPVKSENAQSLFLRITDALLGKVTCRVEREEYFRF